MTGNSQIEKKKEQHVMRPLNVLVPLIREEIELGDKAGLEHYWKAGLMLLEARPQVPHGEWPAWVKRNFNRSKQTAYTWMKAAEKLNVSPARHFKKHTTLSDLTSPGRGHHQPKFHEPVKEVFERLHAKGQRYLQDMRDRTKEDKLVRDLALEIINTGYKVLSVKLHPDKGGNKDSMRRLNEARTLLKEAI